VFRFETSKPLLLLPCLQFRRSVFRQGDEPLQVAGTQSRRFVFTVQQVAPILPDGLQQTIARFALAFLPNHQGFIQQTGKQIQNFPRFDVIVCTHRFRRFQCPAPGENGQPPQ